VLHAEHAVRRSQIARELVRKGLDAFLVSCPPNIRYLSGFAGSNALLLLAGTDAILFTDPRYELQAAEQSDCKIVTVKRQLSAGASRAIRRKRLKRIGFEESTIPLALYESLRAGLPGVRLTPTAGVVEARRAVKSPAEIDLIRRSVSTCSEAFSRSLRRIRPGVKEFELAAEIDHRMRRLGAQRPAFETIVASGPRSALPHADPTAKSLRPNELVLIDMGAELDGYASDMTRTLWLGRPTPKVRRTYSAVLDAQAAALEAVRHDVPAGSVDRRARQVLRRHKLDAFFVHSTGHGLGLEVHESPKIGKRESTRLQAGMVITIEPGVYLEGFGGIRIEDTVLVTNNGCEVLTPTSKDLIVL